MYNRTIKRSFDFIFALLIIIIAAPVYLIIGILLAFSNNGSILFIQERPGYKGKIFKILKFKTMNDSRDEIGKLLPDKDRITKVGRFVRSASLDELPQLFNVLIGDMSLVGPRPLLQKYLHLYTPEQARRHDVKPGITGWAQVNGRNAISWEEKFSFDVYYVDNLSWWLDMKIIALTIKKVFIREGINNQSAATMPEFKGTK